MIELSAAEARALAVRAQGLSGPRPTGGVTEMLRLLGAVQLDTISVLARSHELVTYARLGAVGREQVEAGFWGRARGAPAAAFEYWSHAACLLPIEDWPLFAFRRRHFQARGWRWHEVPQTACAEVLSRLAEAGPLTAAELGGGRNGGDWWDWSDVKIAVEWLLDIGQVAVVRREGWRRVYDLAERVVPATVLAEHLDDTECLRRLTAAAGRTLGVATVADLADSHRLTAAQVRSVIADSGLVEVHVEGWRSPGFADPAALGTLGGRSRNRSTLLSPFDSLVWDRRRTERIFGLRHRLEAYLPAGQRVHGYYAMPLLVGGELRGRVDPKREGSVLHARRVGLEATDAATIAGCATALRAAATWTGCTDVSVGIVAPPAARTDLVAALSD